MKKAQWKQDPRERAFGKDPREVLNDELTAALKKAHDVIDTQNTRIRMLQDSLDQKQHRLDTLYGFRTAYLSLRAKGVVLEHRGEFKHLQNEDMDEFFGIDLSPKKSERLVGMHPVLAAGFSRPTKLLTPANLQQQMEALIQSEFDKAYEEYEWQALQKPL